MRPLGRPLRAVVRPVTATIRQHPFISALLVLAPLLSLPYFIFPIGGYWVRWYWNYAAAIVHPAIVPYLPRGAWGDLADPPRFIEEIYNAPWMGEWDLPELSAPVYSSGVLTSPVIAKIHIFSMTSAEAKSKRDLIRTVSPALNIPAKYRHLVEIKFVLGHVLDGEGNVDATAQAELEEEQKKHGDLLQLNLKNGENLREGKILDWIHTVGSGRDGGREALFLFKVDDDTIFKLPNLLNLLLSLDPHKHYYLGTSLNRWPGFHFHYTGMITGFSWGLVKTLSAGISKMSRPEIETWWDDDVLTGEIMRGLPSAPRCRNSRSGICDPQRRPRWGYLAPPPSPDPRSELVWYDFLEDAGWFALWWITGDIGTHPFKHNDVYLKEWERRIRGIVWKPPKWIEPLADPSG